MAQSVLEAGLAELECHHLFQALPSRLGGLWAWRKPQPWGALGPS